MPLTLKSVRTIIGIAPLLMLLAGNIIVHASDTAATETDASTSPKSTAESSLLQDPWQNSPDPGNSRLIYAARNGLADYRFSLTQGDITVRFPEDMQQGDRVTVTVELRPLKTSKANGLPPLDQYTVSLGSQTYPADIKQFTWEIPKTGLPEYSAWLGLNDPSGKVTAVSQLNVSAPPEETSTKPTRSGDYEFRLPKTTFIGQPIHIKGPFSMSSDNVLVLINGTKARLLAKSPRSVVVQNPAILEGLSDVEIKAGGLEVRGPVYNTSGPAVDVVVDDSCKDEMQAYKAQLYAMVDRGWKPARPPSGGQWKAVVTYNLHRDLTVDDVQIKTSSGYTPLDQSAVERVHQLQGTFLPLPACYDQSALEVEHSFQAVFK